MSGPKKKKEVSLKINFEPTPWVFLDLSEGKNNNNKLENSCPRDEKMKATLHNFAGFFLVFLIYFRHKKYVVAGKIYGFSEGMMKKPELSVFHFLGHGFSLSEKL